MLPVINNAVLISISFVLFFLERGGNRSGCSSHLSPLGV
jgi:hypothetical protein